MRCPSPSPSSYTASSVKPDILEKPISPGDGSDHSASIEGAVLEKGTLDPVYEAKALVLNHAIQEIGMGWYQWQLFTVVGFGWANDNLWPIVTSLILPLIIDEFHPSRPPYLLLAQSVGLLFGAIFWGFGCDVFGRRWAFNLTLGVTAFFGLIAASANSFAAISCFVALWSFGVGGNLPVDSAVFLEFLPGSHQYLLTLLSTLWALAQLLATAVAWPMLANFSCQESQKICNREHNMGWRYFVITMGGISFALFLVRFLAFTVYESPKYLMGKGRDEEAVKVVLEVARRNGKVSDLTIHDLSACEDQIGATQNTNTSAALRREFEKLNFTHIRALFATRKLGLSTGLIMAIWAFIGLAYPLYSSFLPYIQALKGAEFGDGDTSTIYRNSCIIAAAGLPGVALGTKLIQIPKFGRRGALALFTCLTGAFLYCTTTAVTSNSLLGWNCAFNFCSNIMYAVLYGYTPEIFPTKDRGTGNALTATSNRVFGTMAPIIAMVANLETPVPVYTSGALFIIAGLLVFILPFESQGKASL